MRRLEELFAKSFYTMAFIRTLVCIIFLALAMSCSTTSIKEESARVNRLLDTHSIHWEEQTYCPTCPYPSPYPFEGEMNSFYPYWEY